MWKFRPTALSSSEYMYASMTVEKLYELYMDDNAKATLEGVRVPPKSGKSSTTQQILRTCQWNVHMFEPTAEVPDAVKLARKIADRVIETNADVIVLNEFGFKPQTNRNPFHRALHPESPLDRAADCCRERLERHGYSLYISSCFFPTAVATKLPLAGSVFKFNLDISRAVVAVPVAVQLSNQNKSCQLWIYGTHLEAGDERKGAYRKAEMEQFLSVLHNQHTNLKTDKTKRMMVIGDFNQQREQDYTTKEWERICANKKKRGSPENDGVSTMLQEAGFQCVFDKKVLRQENLKDGAVQRNWPTGTPPPSTHWSGTLIDYTYYRGSGLNLKGVYVSPSGLSDHRMVVCDWSLE